ncbi:MAG: hypothetical protein GY784_11010, partial [Gammaproteobacteria bacterium]|nr:hypothetical protein [Gammaproteobacteria bacterium]
MTYIATELPILDGYDKVSGQLAYAADLKIDGLLHCKLVFSSVNHARIKNIQLDNALAVPGVVEVFHHANTPG